MNTIHREACVLEKWKDPAKSGERAERERQRRLNKLRNVLDVDNKLLFYRNYIKEIK